VSGSKRQLWRHGMLLFFLGLLTGLAEANFANIRMGLAAHLEGVMNGTFLLALGVVWPELRLSAAARTTAYISVLYGAYANWACTTLAAGFGTGALSPVTAPGLKAAPWQEMLVLVGFVSVGIAIIGASVLILWGLRGDAERS
jgi:hydroxylaminobenzene mutase